MGRERTGRDGIGRVESGRVGGGGGEEGKKGDGPQKKQKLPRQKVVPYFFLWV